MKKIFALLITFITIMLFCACQPTPKAPVVRGKNEEGIIEAIENSEDRNIQSENSATTYQYNPTWQEAVEGQSDKLSVTVSADVIVPNEGNMPIASIYPIYISEEIAAKMMSVLGQGSIFYPMSKVRTKDDLMTEILELQAWLANPSGDLYAERDRYPDKWQALVDGKQNRIDQLQIEWQSAPETVEKRPLEAVYRSSSDDNIEGIIACCEELETQLNEVNSDGEKEEIKKMMNEMQMVIDNNENSFKISGTADIGKDDVARLTISKNINKPESSMARFTALYDNKAIPQWLSDQYTDKNFDDLIGLSLGYDKALQIAENAITDMGIEYMVLADAAIVSKQDALTYYYEWNDAYRFVFTRQVENAQITLELTDISYSDALNVVWQNEYIEICVDDTGIVKLMWLAPAEVQEVLATNVELLPFEEIQGIFRDYIYIKGAYNQDENIISRETTITQVRLGLMKVQSTQSETGYLLIPVWDFYGYDVNTYSDNTKLKLDENNQRTDMNYNVSYLTINAIDGTIIDREQGY